MTLPFILAGLSIPVTASICFLLTWPLFVMEKKIQWGGRSFEQWRDIGVTCPGERIPAVALVFGAIHTTVAKAGALIVAAWIFVLFGHSMPILFVCVACALMLMHDAARIRRFVGSSGVWTEWGYLVGDVIGVTVGAWVAFRWLG